MLYVVVVILRFIQWILQKSVLPFVRCNLDDIASFYYAYFSMMQWNILDSKCDSWFCLVESNDMWVWWLQHILSTNHLTEVPLCVTIWVFLFTYYIIKHSQKLSESKSTNNIDKFVKTTKVTYKPSKIERGDYCNIFMHKLSSSMITV